MRQKSVQSIVEGEKLAKTIYSSDGRVLLKDNTVLNEFYTKKLEELGYHTVYVHDEHFKDIVVEDVVSENTRSETVSTIKETFEQIKLSQNKIDVKNVITSADKIVEEILDKNEVIYNLAELKSADEYTFFHCANVSVISVILGKALFLPSARLKELAVGSMLHDLGKAKIPGEILNKPGKLLDEEFKLIKKHTNFGFDLLRNCRQISVVSARIALDHHERIDGKGYPKGRKDDEINLLAKICSVADVYDALTSDRCYRPKKMPHEAFEIIINSAGTQFDRRVVEAFRRHVAVYPIGTNVRLNTGEVGVVVRQNLNFMDRPVVRVIKGQKIFERDLLKERTVFINKLLDI